MDEPENLDLTVENPLNLSNEDIQAHEAYLRKNGLDNIPDADPAYISSLREVAMQNSLDYISGLAAQLPESQAGYETTELKLPTSPHEKSFAGEHLERLRRTSGARDSSPDEAAAKTYAVLANYRDDAAKDTIKLNMAYSVPKDGDPYVDPDLARTQPLVREVIAKYIATGGKWSGDFWPGPSTPEYKEKQELARGLVVDIIVNASDMELVRLIEKIYALVENRARFWNRAQAAVRELRIGQRAADRSAISLGGSLVVGHRRPPEAEEPEPEATEPSSLITPEKEMAGVNAHLMHMKELDERVDRMAEQGTDRSTAKRRVFGDKVEVRDEEGNLIDLVEEDQPRVQRGKHSKELHRRRPKPVRYVGPRDTGPPKHISEDMRDDKL